ncbi:MAG: ATP-dependent zinc metalloprotease FtsH [Minicystis sp.]
MQSLWIYLLVIFGTALIFQSIRSTGDDRIPYARFRELADQGQLTDVEIHGDTYVAKTPPDPVSGTKHTYRTGRFKESERDLLARLDEHGVPYTLTTEEHTLLGASLLWLLPIGATIVILVLSTRKGGTPTITNPALSFGKNKARLYVDKGTPVTFGDVAGSEEAKAELAEVVEFLRAPERFRRLGARVPRGVLLVGPPGTGKTLLAKAVAGEAGVPFFSICGSEFVEMFVGVGAARVRDLFAQARERPASILFIDELDAVGKARGVGGSFGGNDEREQTLNQLLTEMDGFDTTSGLIVIGATNRPEILDTALLRPGRFDRRVFVDRPDMSERRAILEVHARRVRLGTTVDLARIAGQTVGLAGADLANLMNEAALLAARRRADAVEQRDLDEAIERAVAGLPRRARRLLPRERTVVAYHEAGHALCSAMLPSQDPVRKISIVPRGQGALGYTIQAPMEDRFLMSRQEILDRLVVLLGGRVAEEIVVGEVSTGAQDDLINATDLARRMVRELGMSETMGVVTFEPKRGIGGDRWPSAPEYSEETARAVDAEVARILADALARTRALLAANRAGLERIAQRLLDVETMTGEDLQEMLQMAEPARA